MTDPMITQEVKKDIAIITIKTKFNIIDFLWVTILIFYNVKKSKQSDVTISKFKRNHILAETIYLINKVD